MDHSSRTLWYFIKTKPKHVYEIFFDQNHCVDKKETLSKKNSFPENPAALTTFEQSPTQHHFSDATQFFQPDHQKTNNHRISEHLNF